MNRAIFTTLRSKTVLTISEVDSTPMISKNNIFYFNKYFAIIESITRVIITVKVIRAKVIIMEWEHHANKLEKYFNKN